MLRIESFKLDSFKLTAWTYREFDRELCENSRFGLGSRDFVAHGLHLGGGVCVAGALGSGQAGIEAGACLVDSRELDECLCGHLVGGDVVGMVVDECVELSEGGGVVAVRDMLHRQAVTREGIAGIEFKNLVECGDLVHKFILEPRFRGIGKTQSNHGFARMNADQKPRRGSKAKTKS